MEKEISTQNLVEKLGKLSEKYDQSRNERISAQRSKDKLKQSVVAISNDLDITLKLKFEKEIEVQELQFDLEKLKDKLADEQDRRLLLEGSNLLNLADANDATIQETHNSISRELKKSEDIAAQTDKLRIQKERLKLDRTKERLVNEDLLNNISKNQLKVKHTNAEVESLNKYIFPKTN